MNPPRGFCECGCGQRTRTSDYTHKPSGTVRGQHLRFVRNHHQRHQARLRFEDRFWSKVDKRGPDECWLWRGTVHHTGYGHFSVGKASMKAAHRICYKITHGGIPEGAHILHTCDIKACVNPAHLRAGSNAENQREAWDRGLRTLRVGQDLPWTKLTAIDVREIRRRYSEGDCTYQNLADEYGVSKTNIGDIVRRSIWKHVP